MNRFPTHKKRGLTLLEMLVSLSLIGLIFGSVIAIYVVGSRAWRKGNVRGELLLELQVISNRLLKDAERTTLAGVTLSPTGDQVSFLKLYDQEGDFALNAAQPIWSGWNVYFVNGSEFRYRDVEWTAPTLNRSSAIPIESFDPPLTLGAYAVGGSQLSGNLETFRVTRVPDTSALTIEVALRKAVNSDLSETLTSETTVRMRN